MFDTVQVGMHDLLKQSGNTDQTVRRSHIKISGLHSIKPTEENLEQPLNPFEEFLKKERQKEGVEAAQTFRFETSDAQPFDIDLNLIKKIQEREEVYECESSTIIEQHGQSNCREVLRRFYHHNYMNFAEDESSMNDDSERNGYQFHIVNIKLIKPQYKKIKQQQAQKQQRFSHYIIKYSKQTQSVHFSDQVNCTSHLVVGDYSRSVVLDKYTGRYYMYDNIRSEVVIRSIRFKDQVCRFKCRVDRKEPVLYLLYKPGVIVVAGGYDQLSDSSVQGSDAIEVFKIDQWTIDTNPILARLRTRRISPIILELKVHEVNSLVILGGHKFARLRKDSLNYSSHKDQNSINNQKAHLIPIQSIEQAIELRTEDLLQPLNLNVKFDGDLMTLHNHIVIEKPSKYAGKQLLIITQSKPDLYQVIYTSKLNTILITRTGEVLSSKPVKLSKQDAQVANLSQSLVSLTTDGKLEITPISKKILKQCCQIF